MLYITVDERFKTYKIMSLKHLRLLALIFTFACGQIRAVIRLKYYAQRHNSFS